LLLTFPLTEAEQRAAGRGKESRDEIDLTDLNRGAVAYRTDSNDWSSGSCSGV
jgi:hypothetical protein